MKTTSLKIIITMVCIVLFASCKTSSDVQDQSNNSQRRQGGQPTVEQLISEMDTNNDGKLSETEVKGPLKDDFSKIDINADGFLSKEELENAPKPERGGQGRPQRGSRN